MSNNPTDKSKSRRPPVDIWLLQLALEAAGNKCLCCAKKGKLTRLTPKTVSRGHINRRKPDGSNDGPENVQPGTCREVSDARSNSHQTILSASA
jgi:hypothetical protein